MSKKRHKKYTVYFKVKVETPVEIIADTYEEAIAKAREFQVKDVVEFDTEFTDGEIRIAGVFEG